MDPAYRNEQLVKDNEEDEEGKGKAISSLAYDILIDILLRLPINSRIQCKSVCKYWYNVFSDPYFTNLQAGNRESALIIQSTNKYGKNKFFMLDIKSGEIGDGFLKFNKDNDLPNCQLVGSCNGLICLFDLDSNRHYYLCNPTTGKHIKSPCTNMKKKDICELTELVQGFGYDPKSNEYMIIRLTNRAFHYQGRDWDRKAVEVYTFGNERDKNWTYIVGSVPFPAYDKIIRVSLNGALHWISNRGLCIVFEIHTKEIRTIEPPLFDFYLSSDSIGLGVLGDCLSLCRKYRGDTNIWVLKQGHWSKEIVIRKYTLAYDRHYDSLVKPIMRLSDEEVLIQHGCHDMTLCNTNKRSLSRVKIQWSKFDAVSHHFSFAPMPPYL